MKRSGDRGIARDRVIGGQISPRRHGDTEKNREIGEAAYIWHPERVGAHATASRRIPTKPSPGNAASGNSHKILKGLLRWFERAIQTLRAVVREIFDQSAYDRFLVRTHASRSIASYRQFTRERDAAMLKKPRCC